MKRNLQRKRMAMSMFILVAGLAGLAGSPAQIRRWIPTQVPEGTQFAGSEACAECHADIVRQYGRSPMRAALESVAATPILRANQRLTFRDGKFRFEIVRRGEQSIYTVTDGVSTISEPVHFSFGQGQAGQTYLLRYRDDYYESRVSFYRDIKGLDLTLGYRGTTPRSIEEAFGRKLPRDEVAQCFACHATNSVSHSRLHLEKMMIGISCEGCHGSGISHIRAVRDGQPKKGSIFNPGILSGDEISQEFCGSCHRSVDRIVGLNSDDGKFNVRFQPYRIFSSKCYSDDRRISCIGCHNPHEAVKRDSGYYDGKCRSCHTGQPPDLEGGAKVCRVGKRDCASCHMPKVDLPGAHFRFTDHRIRIARPGEPYPE